MKKGKQTASRQSIPKEEKSPAPDEEEKEETEEAESTGYGRFEYKNGIIYIGNWKLINGLKMKHGFGKLMHTATLSQLKNQVTEEYEGEWANDLMSGYGVYKYTSGAVFSGNWRDGNQEGFGTYQFVDGSKYEGEWIAHDFHGRGKYIDIDNITWEGEFSKGSFESKNQKKLQAEREMREVIARLTHSALQFFTDFFEKFRISDKKTFKENLGNFFGNTENIAEFVNEPYPKFEERAPEKWAECFHFIHDEKEAVVNVIQNAQETTFFEPERFRADQLTEDGGQVIEFSLSKEEREIQMAICQMLDKNWVLVHFHDTATATGGKKK